jgi:Ca-activated chloride channel family protein
MRQLLASVALLASFVITAPAFATGLIVELVVDDTNQHVLGQLDRLHVDAAVIGGEVSATESRSYRVSQTPGFEAPTASTAQFARSFVEGELVGAPSLLVNGIEVSGEILRVGEADQRRLEWVRLLNDPAPLRELGTPMFVSEPFAVDGFAWSGTQIEFHSSQTLVAHDTMEGVTIPLDWNAAGIPSMTVNAAFDANDPLRAVYSPFHDLSVERDGRYMASASYNGHNVCSSLPLTLLRSTGYDPVHLDLLPFRSGEGEGYLMALLTPDGDPIESAVAPRDIVLVLDTSGSMDGAKMDQAKAALQAVLVGLTKNDSFAIVTFSGAVRTYADDVVLAGDAEVAEASIFVEALRAGGGTALHDGLETGLRALPYERENPRYVVLLTDGMPTEGETDVEAILAMARQFNETGARIFTFGIGNNVNTVLLDRLATESSADAFYIRPQESVTVAVAEFFAQIQAPVLGSPTLDLSAFGFSDTYPAELPELFAGKTVTVFGRYSAPGSAQVQLYGVSGANPTLTEFAVMLPEFALHNPATPRIWATRHVGELLRAIKLGDNDPALPIEALDVARRFGVTTEFTYFVTDEDGNTEFVYAEVPQDVSGSVAVDTSSSIDGYTERGDYGATATSTIRYASDRTFRSYERRMTDTSLPDGPEWVDVHFASTLYFELIQSEVDRGLATLLSLTREEELEFHGAALRISDPLDDERAPLPEESAEAPVLAESEPSEHATVLLETGPAVVAADELPTGADPVSPPLDSAASTASGQRRQGCTSARRHPAPAECLLLLVGLLGLRARRR